MGGESYSGDNIPWKHSQQWRNSVISDLINQYFRNLSSQQKLSLTLPTFSVVSEDTIGALINRERSDDLDTGLRLVMKIKGPENWPLIGGEWLFDLVHLIGGESSRDPDTCLWLVESDHVTWILASDWSRVIAWPGYWPLIGPHGAEVMDNTIASIQHGNNSLSKMKIKLEHDLDNNVHVQSKSFYLAGSK